MARTATNARTASEPDWIRLAWHVYVTLVLSTVSVFSEHDTSVCSSVLQEACRVILIKTVSIVSVLSYSSVPRVLFQQGYLL